MSAGILLHWLFILCYRMHISLSLGREPDDVPEGTSVFDNFFRTFDGRHLLLLVALAVIVTVIVILRSPKAPEDELSQGEARRHAIRKYVTAHNRDDMTDFVLNVLGFGPFSELFENVRSAASQHNELYQLHAALRDACHRLGIDPATLSQEVSGYEASSAFADDPDFVIACAAHIEFLDHLIDLSYSVNTPAGWPIRENEIPDPRVVADYRQLDAAVKARFSDVEVYDRFTSYAQRAVIASFVANVLGYNYNAYAYLRLSETLEEGSPVRLRLHDAIENVIRIHALTQVDWSSFTDNRLEPLLANDRGFILSCAYDIETIGSLVAFARTFTDRPRGLHLPEENPIAAFRALRDYMWQPEAATYEEPRSGQ